MKESKILVLLKTQLKNYKYFASCNGGSFLFADELNSLKIEVSALTKIIKVQKAVRLLKKKGFTVLSTSGLPL